MGGETQPGTFGMRNGRKYKNGTYRVNAHHKTKAAAENVVRGLRRKGYIATVKPTATGWNSMIGLAVPKKHPVRHWGRLRQGR